MLRLGQLVPIVTATRTALDLLVMSVVYLTIYCLYCLNVISAFSKRNFVICYHLLHIQTDVMVKLFKSLVNLMWNSLLYCSSSDKKRKTADWKSAKNLLRCYLNIKAQSMKKHWNELTCTPGYELTCLSGMSWLGWIRVDLVQVDLGTTWPDTPLSSAPNVITVILSTINSLSLNYTVSSRSKTLARTVVKAPKSCQITPILLSLNWLRMTELIEYMLLSLTYKVLTTTQPPYLHNLIFVQRPRITRS